MSDDELMDEARKYEQNLLNFFWRQGVSHFEGEDLVQETYLRLWNYRREYEPSAKLSTFLFLMARQVRIDALRRQTRREHREERWGKEQPATQMPETYAREDVRWAVSQLSEPLREVVELGVFQELPYAEVSAILGIPVGTVKSRMSNAIKKLKEVFDDAGS
ncbi:MAG: RNA polymerase sigma factor [Kiritimatiellae bacterium]|nr:RNA polymerase sigma factor [Kiritimatiellia bacterium]MBQ3343834.1 RNA polymerase sigma factor [Kiritimatiellia bacterium]MBQ6330106.1 RNA polymerase sigma factor [Kiritimatiellia bacterium]